jgi:uncharacterized protein YcbX
MSGSLGDVAGRVVAIWRYPVKSMMGEELNASDVSDRGLFGDRAYALVDVETGKVVSAKNPRKWGNMFEFRASYIESSVDAQAPPPVRITFPDGSQAIGGRDDVDRLLSEGVGRPVRLAATSAEGRPKSEGYWPDEEWLEARDRVFEFPLPPGTFFDVAPVHLLTTATLDRLRAVRPSGRFEASRFRPNFVVEVPAGADGFVEDAWVDRTVAIGDEVRLRVTGPCPRCVMTTLGQGDLPKDPGILRAAVEHNGGNVGVLAAVVRGVRVRRGDAVRVEG